MASSERYLGYNGCSVRTLPSGATTRGWSLGGGYTHTMDVSRKREGTDTEVYRAHGNCSGGAGAVELWKVIGENHSPLFNGHYSSSVLAWLDSSVRVQPPPPSPLPPPLPGRAHTILEETVLGMNLTLLNAPDAVCLDGSPGGFYYAPARTPTLDSWVIELQGGGWCYSPAMCMQRARTWGGSGGWPASCLGAGPDHPCKRFGPLAADPAVNPDFATFHRVIIQVATYRVLLLTVGVLPLLTWALLLTCAPSCLLTCTSSTATAAPLPVTTCSTLRKAVFTFAAAKSCGQRWPRCSPPSASAQQTERKSFSPAARRAARRSI